MIRLLCVVVIATGCSGDVRVVRKWLSDWEVARACMLASPEYGPDGATAFGVSTLVKDTRCQKERIQLLLVTDSDRAKFPGWTDLRTEIDPLVRGSRIDGLVIDRLDAKVSRLRETVQLPAVPRERTRTLELLPAGADLKTIQHGLDAQPSGVDSAEDERRGLVPSGFVLAYPSRTWAVVARRDVLSIITIPDEREIGAVGLPGEFYAARAVDAGATRVVFLQSMDRAPGFAVAISRDAGRTWNVERSPEPLPLTRSSQERVSGIVDIIVESAGQAYLHRFDQFEPWTFAPRVEIPKFDHHFVCRFGGALWAIVPVVYTTLWRIDPPTSQQFLLDAATTEVEACRNESALVLRRQAFQQVLYRCRGDSCTTEHVSKHSHPSAAGLLEDGRWIYAAVVGSTVGVWREGTSPSFYRLREQGELLRVHVVSGAGYLVLRIGKREEVVRLPSV